VSRLFQGTPSIGAHWIKGTRCYPARFPNLHFIFKTANSPTSPASLVNTIQPSAPPKEHQQQPLGRRDAEDPQERLRLHGTTVTAVQSGRFIMSAGFARADMLKAPGFFIVHNRLAELDSPGEFYFDGSTRPPAASTSESSPCGAWPHGGASTTPP
jgi:hypothetical protein